MLKKILENLDGIDDTVKVLYVKKADGKFHLDVEDDDGGALMRAKEHEVGLRKIAERELAEAQAKLAAHEAKIADLVAAQGSSVQELRSSLESEWKGKVAAAEEKGAREKSTLEQTIKRVFVNQVADSIAKDIILDGVAPELLSNIILNRLTVEIIDGTPITRVLTADGKPSTMTPDELKTEYFTNPRFAAIMRATDSSGGGAAGGQGGGGASDVKFRDMGDAQRAKLLKENPAEFHRQVALMNSTR